MCFHDNEQQKQQQQKEDLTCLHLHLTAPLAMQNVNKGQWKCKQLCEIAGCMLITG